MRGSQNSLPRNVSGGQVSNYAMYPPAPNPTSTAGAFESPDVHHASPRIAGTPMTPAGPSKLVSGGQGTPTGPEKPQRLNPHPEESQVTTTSKKSSSSRVRFQDPEADDDNDHHIRGASNKMDQLSLNSNKVEEEFRKRVAEYKGTNGGGGGGG